MEKSVKLQYWTGLCRCCGGEVGGQIEVFVNEKEETYLNSLRGIKCEEATDKLMEECPGLWEKIHDAAVDALEYQMAEDVYGDFDFSDAEFDGWTYEQKIQYIRASADPDCSIDELCHLMVELP